MSIFNRRVIGKDHKRKRPGIGALARQAACQSEKNHSGKVFSHEIPVNQIPVRLHKLGAQIAIVDVVSMLPHITGQQRSLAFSEGATSRTHVDDLNRTVRIFY